MKKTILLIMSILLVQVLSCSSYEEGKSGNLSIIYSGNIGGETLDCGCTPVLGGIARRHTFINDLESEIPNLLVLDSGGMLHRHARIVPPFDKIPPVKENLMFERIVEAGIDAINVSILDLARGVDYLLELDRKLPGYWISSNLAYRDTGELVFTPHKLLDAGELQVGVFGLIARASRGYPFFDSSSPLEILDPVETARQKVRELGREADIIIALVYMCVPEAERLVESVPGIQVVIASHTREITPASSSAMSGPIEVDSTIIVRVTDGGRILGRLDLTMVNGSLEFKPDRELADLRPTSAGERVLENSVYRNRFYELGNDIIDNPEIKKQFQELDDMLRKTREELRRPTS